MDDGANTSDLLRMAGLMTVCVGLSWIVQILGWGEGTTLTSHMSWVMAAASVCGAGVGLVVASGSFGEWHTSPLES